MAKTRGKQRNRHTEPHGGKGVFKACGGVVSWRMFVKQTQTQAPRRAEVKEVVNLHIDFKQLAIDVQQAVDSASGDGGLAKKLGNMEL